MRWPDGDCTGFAGNNGNTATVGCPCFRLKMYTSGMIRPGSKIYRWVWLSVTWLALGLAAAGAILPVMPTTPFLLVALWAGSRASPRFRFWLFRHPRYGPALRAWHRHRAIPLRARKSTRLNSSHVAL